MHTEFVPDEIVDRFCLLGPVEEHVRAAEGARRARRRSVRRLPAARREGRDAAGLRREGPAGDRRARAREVLTAAAAPRSGRLAGPGRTPHPRERSVGRWQRGTRPRCRDRLARLEPLRGCRRSRCCSPSGAGVDTWPRGRPLEARCSVPAIVRPRRREPRRVPSRPAVAASTRTDRSMPSPGRRPAWPPAAGDRRGLAVGTHRSSTSRDGARGSPTRPGCGWCARCARGSSRGPASRRSSTGSAGCVYALCRRHRGGIEVPDGRRTSPLRSDPEALQARLLDAYAVDLLPLEAIEELFARPAALPEPGSKPAIRAVLPAE